MKLIRGTTGWSSLRLLLMVLFCSAGALCAKQLSLLSIHVPPVEDEAWVSVWFEGEFFSEPRPLSPSAIDRSSAQKLAGALFKAVHEQDTNLYAEVFNVDVSKITYTPNPQNKAVSMSVVAEILYGDLSILLIDLRLPSHTWIETFHFKRENGKYYGLLQRPEGNVLELLDSYCGYGAEAKLTFSDKASFQSELKGRFAHTNTPASGGPALVVTFPGKAFAGLEIDTSKPPKETNAHASPEALFTWSAVHAKDGNTNGYLQLVDTLDLSEKTHWGTVQSYIEKDLSMTSRMMGKTFSLTHSVVRGDLAIVFYKAEKGNTWWMPVRNRNGKWHITNAFADQRAVWVFHAILRYFDVATAAFPNVLPSRE